MKLATTTGDFGYYMTSQQEGIRWIAQAGFHYIDYSFGHDYVHRNGVYAADWHAHVEDLQKTAQECGVKFVQAHAPMGRPLRSGRGSDYYNAFIADTVRAIEVCGMMGVENLVVHSDYKFRISREEAFRRNYEFYHDLLPAAEKWNVNLLIENFNKMEKDELYWVDNAADLLEMIETVNHPLCHACWDVGHANMQEMSQLDELRILGSHVRALHVQDNHGNADSHFAPFYGTTNFDMLMHALKEINYGGYFTFESNVIQHALTEKRRPFAADTRLLRAPLAVMLKAEELLYEIGKSILEAYDCFEE